MEMQSIIEQELAAGLDPVHLEVINESHRHNVPPGAQSHFKVVVVSRAFEDMGLLARHRRVYGLLGDAMHQLHALAVHAYTEAEWREAQGGAPASPPCLGGGRRSA